MFFGFPCPRCGLDLEADLVITAGGYPSAYEDPGEAAEWHARAPVTCDPADGGCGAVVTDDALSAAHEPAIQQAITERDFHSDPDES